MLARKVATIALVFAPAAAAAAGDVLVPLEGPPKTAKKAEWSIHKALEKLGKPVRMASLPLEDIKMAVDCSDDSPACMGNIAKMLEADSLLVGKAEDQPAGALKATLKKYDASGKPVGEYAFTMPGKEKEDVEAAFVAFGGKPAGAPPEAPGEAPAPAPAKVEVGTLVIEANAGDVAIALDGEPRGATPLRIEGVYASRYEIEATRKGYYPWKGEVVVLPGKESRISIRLDAMPAGEEPEGGGAAGRIRARTWIAAGAGAAALVVGGIFGARAKSAQSDIDDTAVATPGDLDALESRADEGERSALIANVALAVGGAAVVGAFVLGYLDLRAAPPRRASARDGGFAIEW